MNLPNPTASTSLHTLFSSFVLGYHGCDQSVADAVLRGEGFIPSENDYDWLGKGIYFWDTNPQRGLDWARYLQKHRGKIKNPAVVGAVIDLGYSLDLLSANGITVVRETHRNLVEWSKRSRSPLPENVGGKDLLRRHLDCAVINHLHSMLKAAKEPALDTVRAVFIEGDPIYEKSGFYERSHIQICVCNPDAIKGVFRVKPSDAH